MSGSERDNVLGDRRTRRLTDSPRRAPDALRAREALAILDLGARPAPAGTGAAVHGPAHDGPLHAGRRRAIVLLPSGPAAANRTGPDDSFIRQCAAAPALPIDALLMGPGRVLNQRIRIIREIGAGGTARVYRGRDLRLARPVAVKVLRMFGCAGIDLDHALRRFEREAQMTAQLNHQNTVTLYEASSWRDIPFIVLELLDGAPLTERIESGRPSACEAATIMAQVAQGLAHAHAKKIVHGDVKPGNIFVERSGRVKLLDFGLAEIGAGSRAALGPLRRPTDKDACPPLGYGGTPAYMAPEQLAGEPPSARSDLWAVGVTLLQLLTGQLPPGDDGADERPGTPPTSALAPELRGRFGALLASLLQRDPTRRWQRASTLADELWELSAMAGDRQSTSAAAARVTRRLPRG